MVFSFFVLRHGKAGNAFPRRFVSRVDIDLLEEGRADAILAGEKIKATGKKIVTAYCSPWKRSRETAELIVKQLGYDVQIEAITDLQDIYLGPTENVAPEEVMRKNPLFRNDENFSFGEESHKDVYNRSVKVIHELEKKHQGECVLIVTHSEPLNAILCKYMNIENWLEKLREGWPWGVPYYFEVEKGKTTKWKKL